VESCSSSTHCSLDREGIKIDKDKEETKAKLELEPALPAKVRRLERNAQILSLARKTSITDTRGCIWQVLHAFTIKSGSQLARFGR
jgi:hypothetical protein